MTKTEERLWAYAETAVKYNEADWSDTKECVITARDFKSLKAEE